MSLNIEMLVIVLVALIGICQCEILMTCEKTWKKVGCYKDTTRPLSQELLNIRDTTNPAYKGYMLDWKNYDASLTALACECNKLAKAKGFRYFGLQFFGECWSGPSMDYSKDGLSTNCVNSSFKPCVKTSSDNCVGKAKVNYIYDTLGTRTKPRMSDTSLPILAAPTRFKPRIKYKPPQKIKWLKMSDMMTRAPILAPTVGPTLPTKGPEKQTNPPKPHKTPPKPATPPKPSNPPPKPPQTPPKPPKTPPKPPITQPKITSTPAPNKPTTKDPPSIAPQTPSTARPTPPSTTPASTTQPKPKPTKPKPTDTPAPKSPTTKQPPSIAPQTPSTTPPPPATQPPSQPPKTKKPLTNPKPSSDPPILPTKLPTLQTKPPTKSTTTDKPTEPTGLPPYVGPCCPTCRVPCEQ